MAFNKNDLITLVSNLITDNGNKENTAARVRQALEQILSSNVNLLDTTAQDVTGLVNYLGGIQRNGSELIHGVNEVEILRAFSVAASQEPAALDTPLQIEFGAAQGDINSDVQISALGAVTFNKAGLFPARIKLQGGRTGSSGVALIFARILVNGTQVGVSQSMRVSSSDITVPSESRVVIPANVGDVLTVEIVRDSSGVNSGGLFGDFPVLPDWNDAPSALLVVSEYQGLTS